MADPSKTEKPTPRRRTEAREEGQVARSVEANTAVIFIVALVLFRIFGPGMVDKMTWLITYSLQNIHQLKVTHDNLPSMAIWFILFIAWITWPFIAGFIAVIIILNIAQVGLHVSFKAIAPKFSKLNPLTNFKSQFLSSQLVANLIRSLAKTIVATYIVYAYLRDNIWKLLSLQNSDLSYGFVVTSKVIYDIVFRLIIFFVVLAAADYAWNRYKFEESLKMTKEEVKEERKRSEGNPQIKSAIRRRQRQMSRNRMMSQVPKADVVVTNPTHLAVALQYDADKMRAPVVVAKGADYLAETIKKVAKESKIPIIENKPLAQSLYKLVEIDEEIPADLFNAVAEILTYVHKLTGKMYGIGKE